MNDIYHNAIGHYCEGCYAQCRFAECCHAECHGALLTSQFSVKGQYYKHFSTVTYIHFQGTLTEGKGSVQLTSLP